MNSGMAELPCVCPSCGKMARRIQTKHGRKDSFYYSETQRQVQIEQQGRRGFIICGDEWEERDGRTAPPQDNYFQGKLFTEAIEVGSTSNPSYPDAVLLGEGPFSEVTSRVLR